MDSELLVLYFTAASIGFFHTLVGPDHYLPFVMMSKARNWSLKKTGMITFLCGLGHVLSSVILGIIGVMFGLAVMRLEALESFRGNIAAWLLIGFGFAYFVWGIRSAIRNKPHKHIHLHGEINTHAHEHAHIGKHSHVHAEKGKNITPWILFTIFVFGPCEPLIPILMYPAARHSLVGMVFVAIIFSVVTIATMMSIVMLASLGMKIVPMGKLQRYSHALAGVTIFLSGLAIQILGL